MPSQPPISLLLKSSTSTFFLILPSTPSPTFSTLQSTLFSLLESNKPHLPDALRSNFPSSPEYLKLGLPKDSSDPKKGFVALDNATFKNGKGTVGSAGIKDGQVLAFAVVDEGEDNWDGEFDVKWPVDEYYESQNSQK
ncbi:hypothetical protein ABW19_dt0203103 [Dactylella cylindrospora]|nr:hypothetical protein ABW19_dt0203103 [Dactylella cylindrospora]